MSDILVDLTIALSLSSYILLAFLHISLPLFVEADSRLVSRISNIHQRNEAVWVSMILSSLLVSIGIIYLNLTQSSGVLRDSVRLVSTVFFGYSAHIGSVIPATVVDMEWLDNAGRVYRFVVFVATSISYGLLLLLAGYCALILIFQVRFGLGPGSVYRFAVKNSAFSVVLVTYSYAISQKYINVV